MEKLSLEKPRKKQSIIASNRTQETIDKMIKTKKENGSAKGSRNPMAKIIIIYDSFDEVKYVCKGTFIKTCKENNLPFKSLLRSYQSNGTKIYSSSRGEFYAKKFNNEKYINWYAKIQG